MPWTAVPAPATVVFALAPVMSRTVFSETSPVPALAVVLTPGAWSWIPRMRWTVPVPALVRFATVLLETVNGIVVPTIIPITCWPVAAAPGVTIWMLFAVVALPTTLPSPRWRRPRSGSR